jgi:hypothetical protein
MRRILPAAITFAALALSTTGVRADGTWCVHYGTGLEGMNCGFYSFEQCHHCVGCRWILPSQYIPGKRTATALSAQLLGMRD